MGKIIAVTNQKGGVGKTTTSVNLAASLAATKRRVLLIDLDPQGNATMGCGVDKSKLEQSSCNLLLGESEPQGVIQTLPDLGFDLVPGNADLTAAEVELMQAIQREKRLAVALASCRDNYDYLLIDCPPSLNMLTLNAMAAADTVLIPMQCEYYALEGLSALMDTLKKIRKWVNPELSLEGLLRTMYDPRSRLAREVSEQLLAHFPDKVFRTVIPRNIRLAEAPSHGLPVLQYDRTSSGALAYLALASELARRNPSPGKAAAPRDN
ncbi:ParA family protein [Methylogaea oryzae]|uniref:Chromosome partitioning protein ParA n=1 Tax=Methylogaea oryzae TaxID=1295382 RepID=A0A8D4VV89_9GAMM|nr:ParA family protein [Methylogaea oryzae]BBL72880.1 chromosome partitioning protein ParA [Methylogaea oryzae]